MGHDCLPFNSCQQERRSWRCRMTKIPVQFPTYEFPDLMLLAQHRMRNAVPVSRSAIYLLSTESVYTQSGWIGLHLCKTYFLLMSCGRQPTLAPPTGTPSCYLSQWKLFQKHSSVIDTWSCKEFTPQMLCCYETALLSLEGKNDLPEISVSHVGGYEGDSSVMLHHEVYLNWPTFPKCLLPATSWRWVTVNTFETFINWQDYTTQHLRRHYLRIICGFNLS
jgi:hypothetical protein